MPPGGPTGCDWDSGFPGAARIVRANVEITEEPLGQDRASFTGTLEQIAGDMVATRTLGAAELLFTRMEQLRDIASRA